MRRYICAAGIAGALLACALVIVPRTVQAAPVHAGTASIRLAAVVKANAAVHPAARAHVARVAATRASRVTAVHRGTAYSRVATTRYAGATTATRYGTTTYARMGYSTYGRFSAAYSRGYASRVRYAATGTTHNCPHMTSTSSSTSGK